jgi:succinoglycan biosynthesis transport protein ExoP
VNSLEKSVAEEASVGTKRIETNHADNPVYIQVKGQLDAVAVDRASAVAKRDELQAKFQRYEKFRAELPEVERQYHTMARDLESAQFKYQEILSKQTEAQVSQNLETERKGERFTLIEPPQPPEKPISPNRKLILIAGLFLSLGLGAGVVAARDSMDATVRGPGDVRSMLQVPVLASIPIIVTAAERARRKRLTLYSWSGSLAAILLAMVSVHLFVKPLDVVWLSLVRRFGA